MINPKASLLSLLFLSIIMLLGCDAQVNSPEAYLSRELPQEWKDYWYSGKAELNRYELEQARYGEVHKGDAVLIFVTEDFLTDKQVKYEGGPKDQVGSVLKLNATKKFWTGIYPYSLMTSTFTPISEASPSLKVTTSAQEWCGHSYSQLNLKEGQYVGLLHSYFMQEGDQEFSLDAALLEDEVWNQIRLDPKALLTGTIQIIPGMQFLRLGHRALQVETAKASLLPVENSEAGTGLTKYRLEYEGFNRVLEITFENSLPHKITGWVETSGGGRDGTLTTKARLTNSIKSPYWGKNSLADSVLRHELGFKE